jgi:hypothetical protein
MAQTFEEKLPREIFENGERRGVDNTKGEIS